MARFLLLTSIIFAWPVVAGADEFDHYLNPILAKVPSAEGVKEVKELTPELIADHGRVIPSTTAAMLVVQTNQGRFCKLLVQAARVKTDDENKTQIPILLIERFLTYREGTERAVQATGQNVYLFDGFHFNLDLGQVVPEKLGGDLRFISKGEGKDRRVYAEPVGKAKLYLVTKALPEAKPPKGSKLVVGETFEIRYYNGTYKLYDDGRRSGTLTLKVNDDGEISGAFFSDKDGQKYEVKGKVGSPKHAVQFAIKFPQVDQEFQGWLFTGNGKALAGSSKLQNRESGFYAVRVEDE